MSTNYLLNVPKLKGRENYSEWTFAAENFLILEDMLHCVKPGSGKQIVAAEDARTKAKLVLTIDSSLYVHIKDVTTSKQLWDKLKALFDDSGFTRRISLLRNLISIRLENSSSMTSYVTQIVETGQKLNGTGFQISDEWIGCLLLAGLTDKYSPMIMAIEHSGISITTDAIKSKLMDLEETEVVENASDVSSAFATSQKWQHKNKKWSMANGSTNGGKMAADNVKVKPNVRCYKCKQTGHYRNQCTNVENCSPGEKKTIRKPTNAFSAVFLNGNFNKNEWYIDSGASKHLTANEHWITNACYLNNKEIIVANSNKVKVLCSGDVNIVTETHECEFDVPVTGVLCVTDLTTNLLSVSQLIRNGNQVTFSATGCSVYNKNGKLVAMALLINGVYKLRMPERVLAASAVTAETWHRRLGHVNSEYMKKMTSAVQGINLDEKIDITKSSCTVCCEGKQCRLPFNHIGLRSSEVLSVVHTDICGPMETESLAGSKYFLLFVDDYSRMIFVYFVKHKSEALTCFKDFKAKVENQTGKKIKTIRSDNGREYCNKDFDLYLQKYGINHQKTNPYTPEQNGLCERSNRTIVEKARCLLFDANLSKEFWAEATNTAVYLQNRIVANGLNGKTPYEMWTGNKPDISHLRVFGSVVMVHIAKERRHKWDRKSEKHLLVGYSENIKGYRVYNLRTKNIITSRDIIVIEESNKAVITIPVKEQIKESSVSVGETLSDAETAICESFTDNSDSTFIPSEYEDADEDSSGSNVSVPEVRKSNRERKGPQRYGWLVDENIHDDGSDLTLQEALEGPEKEQWLNAVNEELQSFNDNGAWELVDAPKSGTIVKCKWVLKKKYDSDNKVRFRARLVAKGFMQKQGVDYSETFSPVVRHTTLRMLFALSVQLGLDVTHLDVTTAFLNGELDETVYMHKPDCFSSPECDGKVLKLKKAIYGLKQSSRAWYRRVDDCLVSIGYKRSNIEPCLYIKTKCNKKTIVTLYVDDFFVFSNDTVETTYLKDVLSSHFKIKDLGELKQCLGMSVKIDKTNGVITLNQKNYIEQLLYKFQMTECKMADTPLETKLNISKEENCKGQFPYQQLIGSLMYLAVLTRPDIAFSVGFLSQFNNCFNQETWSYAKRILKYLKKTKDFGLTFKRDGNKELIGFVDADWASNVVDRKSYTGLCFLLSGAAISWETKKQKTVALSSTEAEYMGLSEACREAIYLRNLFFEITNNLSTISVFNDNQGALKLSVNNLYHKRTKHIDIRYHFCRECVTNKIVNLIFLETAEMPADLLTKGLANTKHYYFMELLGIKNV